MKKMISLFLLSLALFSCTVNVEDQPSNDLTISQEVNEAIYSNTGDVSLVRAYATTGGKYGMTWYDRDFIVKVKNLAYSKKVSIHHKNADGTWSDYAAAYKSTVNGGFEIWTLHLYSSGNNPYGNQFVVKYEVNGNIYFDNNNGQNYTLNANDGIMLGKNINVLNRNDVYIYPNSGYINFNIDVRNLAYSKNVKVIYTTDNWATRSTLNAQFNSYYMMGYSYQQSPNIFGSENWTASVNLGYTPNSLKFFIQYDVNGKTYYDNNFGVNYTATKY